MKKIAFLFVLWGATCNAQQWNTDLKSALRSSTAQSKHVLLYFTGGKDCENCTKLEQNILDSPEFGSFAAEHFVLVKQDFQSKENLEENLLIVEKYNKDGFFPWVVIISGNGKPVGQLGVYQDETPAQYVHKLQSLLNR